MKLLRLMSSAVAAFAMLLAACGGGGGSAGSSPFPGGGTNPTPTPVPGGNGSGSVSVQLVSTGGQVINPPTLTGTQNAVVVVTVRDANGAVVPNAIVTVTSSALTMTPASGTQLTDASGEARVQVQPKDPLGGGATTIAVSASTGAEGSLNVALGAASATLGTMTASSTTVAAYQTLQVSVPVTLSGSASPAVQIPVSFTASCGTFDPAQANSDSNGVASSTYRNQTGTTACAGPVTLSAQVGSSTANAQITASAPQAANIQFVNATPSRIYLAGSPGVSQSIVTFKLVDSSNNAVAGQNIDLNLSLRPTGAYLGSVQGTTTVRQSTDSTGQVSVAVNAGTAPGPVQIEAVLVSQPAIKNVSNTLAVASGLPVQKAFSLSVTTFNIEAWGEDGVETTINLRVADRLGNPVPDGTTINLVAEGGQVVASCNTAGASSNNTAACSAKLVSQNPRPADGRVTVLTWAQGEETFEDAGTPSNNVYDSGEVFEDLGQPFLDKNEDGAYQAGSDVTVGTAPGSQACPTSTSANAGYRSVAGTCNGAWGSALVRHSTVIVFSGDVPYINPTTVGVDFDTAVASAGERCVVTFPLVDQRGNPLPAGTTLSVANIVGGNVLDGQGNPTNATFSGFGGEGDKVPNTSDRGRIFHSAVFSKCTRPQDLRFDLTVSTPKGKKTTVFYP